MVSALLMGAIIVVGGKDYVIKYYGNITAAGRVMEEYQPITNTSAPSYVALKGQLESEGIKVEDSELSMFSFSGAAFQYRWLRGDESRVYVVRMNSHGMWDIYPQ